MEAWRVLEGLELLEGVRRMVRRCMGLIDTFAR